MIAFLIGIAAGILGGMGIGGGTILIPSLIIFMNINQHTAQSINLISFIPAAMVALIHHFKNKNIEIGIIKYLIFPGIFGSITGSLIAIKLNPILLKKLFGAFLFIMGLFEILSVKEKKNKWKSTY